MRVRVGHASPMLCDLEPMRTTTAVRITEHGGRDVLRYGEYELADVGPSDALVEVDTASVSRWDLKYRTGLPESMRLPGRIFFPLPQQLGREAAGWVRAVGRAVTTLAVGDAVAAVVHPENALSPEATRGQGNLSSGIEVPGHQSLGAYARYLVRDESLWFKLPPGTDLEQAAVTLWPFSTSHRILRDRLKVGLGDRVLVLGASGGMGQATLQLARLMGARPVAVTRSAAKADGLRRLGAETVVLSADLEDSASALEAICGPVDHVIDYVGDHRTIRAVLALMRPGASICFSTGEQDANAIPLTGADFVRLELNALGIRGARRQDALVALDLLTRGLIATPIVARYPLAHVAQAHAHLEDGLDEVGRIVLKPATD